MGESGYYPIGTEYSSSSPWNMKGAPEKAFNVTVSQTLSKDSKVTIDDYYPETPTTEEDTSETNWKDLYLDEHETPLTLLNIFKETLINNTNIEKMSSSRKSFLIKECSDWTEDDYEVCED